MSVTLRDFSSDTGRQLLHGLAVKFGEFPEYVMSASEDDLATAGHEAKCAHLSSTPRLPTHTKAATFLSYACFMEQRNELPKLEREKIANYLEQRIERWDLADDVAKLEATESEMIKQASVCTEEHPVRNLKEAQAANVWLDAELKSDKPSIDVASRIDLARKIAEWIEPTQAVSTACCLSGCCDGKKVAAKLREYNKDRNNGTLEQLAKVAEESSPAEMQLRQGEAALILERTTDIGCPESFLKVSSDAEMTYLSNGAVIESSKLASFTSNALFSAWVLRQSDGPVLAGSLDNSKLAEWMQPDLADMLCDDLRKAGIAFEVKPPVKDFSAIGLNEHA